MENCIIVDNLTCNHRVNPIGIDTNKVILLSWKMYADGFGQVQSAYRIVAASALKLLNAGEYDLWGRVL